MSLKFFTGNVAILMPTFGRRFEGYDKLSIDKHHIQHIINAGEIITQHTYFLFSLVFFGCISPLTLTFKTISSFFSLPLPLLLLLSYFPSHKQINKSFKKSHISVCTTLYKVTKNLVKLIFKIFIYRVKKMINVYKGLGNFICSYFDSVCI